jgi:hypothetical protein
MSAIHGPAALIRARERWVFSIICCDQPNATLALGAYDFGMDKDARTAPRSPIVGNAAAIDAATYDKDVFDLVLLWQRWSAVWQSLDSI